MISLLPARERFSWLRWWYSFLVYWRFVCDEDGITIGTPLFQADLLMLRPCSVRRTLEVGWRLQALPMRWWLYLYDRDYGTLYRHEWSRIREVPLMELYRHERRERKAVTR